MEKLTENLGVKLSDVQIQQLRGVAEASNTTPSELVHMLIERHLAAEFERYVTLHSIFGDAGAITKANKASHG